MFRFRYPLLEGEPGVAGGGAPAAVVAPVAAAPVVAPTPTVPKPPKGEPREPSAFEKGIFKRLGLKVRQGESIDEAMERHKAKLSERKLLRSENESLKAQTPLLTQYMEIALSSFSPTERAAIEAIGKGDFSKTLDTIRMARGGIKPPAPAADPAAPVTPPGVQPAAGAPAPAAITQALQTPRTVQPGLTTSAAPTVSPGTATAATTPKPASIGEYRTLLVKNPWLASAYAAQNPQIFDKTG